MESLRELYEASLERFAQFVKSFPNEHFNGPLLMDPSRYFQQPKKLLVIGQETYGWSCKYYDIDAQFDFYRMFNAGENKCKSPHTGPFWNITRKVEKTLGIESYSTAYSNLNRFDHNGGPPKDQKVLEELLNLDFIVKEEIQILKPDICLFYTNRKYDYRIKVLYPGVQLQNIEGLPSNHFVHLIHKSLPTLTFRTPHPRTIRMKRWEDAFLTFMGSLTN